MAIKIGNNDITFKVGSTDVDAIYLGTTLMYSGGTPPTPHDYSQDYLTFNMLGDGTLKLSTNKINYSLDGGSSWTELPANTNTPTISSGSSVLVKGENMSIMSSSGVGRFDVSCNYTINGNIMSLIYGDNFVGQTSLSGKSNVFKSLFNSNTSLLDAEDLVLPATTLTGSCYNNMFYGCTNLTKAPQLPATTLATKCYTSMFLSTKITTAPILPATTLAESCYQNMFTSCTSLIEAPVLSATTLVKNCYNSMFYSCTNLSSITCLATDISASNCTTNWVTSVAANGTFTKASSMNDWTTGVNGIPSNWTVVDYTG